MNPFISFFARFALSLPTKTTSKTMRYRNMIYVALAVTALTLPACSDTKKEEARAILNQAKEQFGKGNFDRTLELIDSLRHSHPEAIEERKEALTLFQDASEKLAQQQIVATDKQLQNAIQEYDRLWAIAEKRREDGYATPEELTALTKLKLKKDSLQARFDTQCATVRMIREKRKSGQ